MQEPVRESGHAEASEGVFADVSSSRSVSTFLFLVSIQARRFFHSHLFVFEFHFMQLRLAQFTFT